MRTLVSQQILLLFNRHLRWLDHFFKFREKSFLRIAVRPLNPLKTALVRRARFSRGPKVRRANPLKSEFVRRTPFKGAAPTFAFLVKGSCPDPCVCGKSCCPDPCVFWKSVRSELGATRKQWFAERTRFGWPKSKQIYLNAFKQRFGPIKWDSSSDEPSEFRVRPLNSVSLRQSSSNEPSEICVRRAKSLSGGQKFGERDSKIIKQSSSNELLNETF